MIKEAIGIANTLSLAQKNACEALGVSEQEVKFEVIQMPTKKTLGLFGGKPAKVKAVYEISPAKIANDYLHNLLVAYGLKDFTLEMQELDDGVAFHVTGENSKIIIGRRGDTLDAIQYLVGLVANDASDSYYRVTINVENYRERREKTLEILGRSLAFRAINSGQQIVLEPMTPYERKVIHMAVEKVIGAKSWSEGEDLERHIIVAPDEKVSFKNHKRISN